jgi:hypothetical protein
VTVFDFQKEIDGLMARYEIGKGSFEFDAEERGWFDALLGDGPKNPRARLLFLRELDSYNPMQIAMALEKYQEIEKRPQRPWRYFLAMVVDAADRFTKRADEIDQQEERRGLHDRTHKEFQEQRPEAAAAEDQRHDEGFNTAGAILRNMPEVRRVPDS